MQVSQESDKIYVQAEQNYPKNNNLTFDQITIYGYACADDARAKEMR